MNKDFLIHASNAIMLALSVGIPVSFAFCSRWSDRSWLSAFRLFLAIPCSVAAISALFDTILYASAFAHTRVNPDLSFGTPPLIRVVILVLFVAILLSFVFSPPSSTGAWPSARRRLLAIICAVALAYGLFFAVAYYAILAYLRSDPPGILDGPTHIHPLLTLATATIVSFALFISRLCYAAFRPSNRHDTSLPTARNA